jgi:hypothetical protein
VASRAADELLVRGLDRQEAGKCRLAGRIGMIDLGQPAVRALDILE